MKKKGFTLIELLVVIAIIAMLLAILMPALGKVKRLAERLVCGTNLKGMGTAQNTYAFDYDDEFAVQGGKSQRVWGAPGQDNAATSTWQIPGTNWNDTTLSGTMTIGASLYLLVRDADVDPKSFVCRGSGQTAYDGTNPGNYDLTELWDFGSPGVGAGVVKCLSYAYQQPYTWSGTYPARPASGASSASMPIMADKNPFFDATALPGVINQATETDWQSKAQILTADNAFSDGFDSSEKWRVQVANSAAHNREGQNVLYGDGHVDWTKTSAVGVEEDNIYTNHVGAPGAVDQSIKSNMSVGEIGKGIHNNGLPRSDKDAVLANDDYRTN